ncbi:hypothetical protein [Oryzobacter terrae]|uniref:hypothetical protein n=1 Tax=Oryzobacter terrae TaxID=1620385 RepID=UPI00366DBBE0
MIGYYVHHHGRGHLTRMLAVAAHLREELVGLSSLPAPDGWAGRWVELGPDDDPAVADEDDADVRAGGVLHWAPRHHPGLGDRMAALASWVARERPALVVVDVSVEVALLLRLCGVPVVVTAMPGDRTDRPHRAAHDLADALLAPWPAEAHSRSWPESWTRKVWPVGGISRFDGLPRPTRVGTAHDASRVLLLWGAGGRDVDDAAVRAAQEATPGWRWTERSPDAPSPDLWLELCTADVVVTHAGQNAVADVAAARAPAVVLAQHRPHGEQQATVEALSRLDVADGRSTWPSAREWPDLLDRAQRRGGGGWERWSTGRGALAAATHLDALAGAQGGRATPPAALAGTRVS